MSLSSRQLRLNELYNKVIAGKTTIGINNAKLFLEAVCQQQPAVEAVPDIVTRPEASSALHLALSADTSRVFIDGQLTKFLHYIQEPGLQVLCGGSVVGQLCKKIAGISLLWQSLIDEVKAQTVSEDATGAFAWLLLQLIDLPRLEALEFLPYAQDASLRRVLLHSSKAEHRAHGQRIINIADNLSAASALHTPATATNGPQPGGRHDNDYPEIHKISIYPTAEELATQDVYLPVADEVAQKAGDENALAIHIDAQFRLLREDMIRDVRDEIDRLSAKDKQKAKRKSYTFSHLRLIGAHGDGRNALSLQLECTQDLPQLKGRKSGARQKYLEKYQIPLREGFLTCLTDAEKVIAVGKVVYDKTLLAKVPSRICVQLSTSDLKNTLLTLKAADDALTLFQTTTALFAYEPVLKKLQEMRELSMEAEIIAWSAGASTVSPPNYLFGNTVERLLADLQDNPQVNLKSYLDLEESVTLDRAQAQCFSAALQQRLAVIQGPPGTGKSFTGSLIAKAIHSSTKQQVLLICYTHHAVDDAIQGIIKMGVPKDDIVRLGTVKKGSSDIIKQVSMFEQRKLRKMTKSQWEMLDNNKKTANDAGSKVAKAFLEFLHFRPDAHRIMEHLEFLEDEPLPFFDAFQIPSSEDGMILIGENGRRIKQSYLLDRWKFGHDAGVLRKKAETEFPGIWSLSRGTRRRKYEQWEKELQEIPLMQIQKHAKSYDSALRGVSAAFLEKDLPILRGKRIIACTTTAAAMYTEALRSISPGVLLVEEAGEVLESHVLTALSPKTKHLILIGDHKQLRPKCNFDLSVERGTGYDLNRSMFERLILKDFPYQILSAQHRMRPEISALVRALTYPDLTDADKTQGRPNLRGFEDFLVFVNHKHAETELTAARDSDPTATSSKQNLFEAKMVLKCVRYLGQQGYKSEHMVVLTPYLGQLRLLVDELKCENDPVLNDLDSHDLVRAGLMPAATAKLNKAPLRFSSIDNYQGEESDIVIVSLTRSNPNRDIGFMHAPERLNVLLSRARNALIMIGDAEHFMGARKGGDLWQRFIQMMKEKNHIYDGLPVYCERHPDRTILLKQPEDFETQCPDGGCTEPCEEMLSCGNHRCPSKCHRFYDHKKVKCLVTISSKCPSDHRLVRKCHEPESKICPTCVAEQEDVRREAERKLEEIKVQDQHRFQMAQVDRELKLVRAQMQSDQAAHERLLALEQKKKDLEATKERQKAMAEKTSAPSVPSAPEPGFPTTANTQDQTQNKSGPQTTNPKPVDMVTRTPAPIAPTTGLNAPKSGSPVHSAPTGRSVGEQNQIQNKSNEKPIAQTPTAPQQAKPNRDETDSRDTLPPLTAKLAGTSPAEQEWARKKRVDGARNASLDDLMRMTGLEAVKQKFLDIKAKLEVATLQGRNVSKERLGMTMLGNPGTGKTTAARLYGKMLASLDAVPGEQFVEISGSSLANEGVNGAKKMINDLAKDGGIFFLDEAYQLANGNSSGGKAVLDLLLAEIEERRGTIVFVLAGYTKEMEKFFEHNPGFPSRVPEQLTFADYSDSELLAMFRDMVTMRYNTKARFEGGLEGLFARILVRRLGRRRKAGGFGNARDLENCIAKVAERQANRISKERAAGGYPDVFQFLQSDIIGPAPTTAFQDSNAWEKLKNLIGLKKVKLSLKGFVDRIQVNYNRELQEQAPLTISLNRIFLGSPGVGKTTVAMLYGKTVSELGLLSKSEVVSKTAADFIGAHIGQSEEKAKEILKAAVGKVLVIDEAYALDPMGGNVNNNSGRDPYKAAVIDTIVAEVHSEPGADRCVLLLGYQEPMRAMLKNANPGLSRRFPLESAFHFEDFDDAELKQVLELRLVEDGLKATDQAKDVAMAVLRRARDRPNFGNAGQVNIVLSDAKDNWQKRQVDVSSLSEVELLPEDFDPEHDRAKTSAVAVQNILADIVGLQDLKQKLHSYQKMAHNLKLRQDNPKDPRKFIPFTYVFKGPPGTGKTTLARKIAEFYYAIEVLATKEYTECSASDLIGQYVGHSGPKTREMLRKSLGGVLFIDEAYRLNTGRFAQESIDEIVDCLTKPEFENKLVVILAGYTDDMNDLLLVNSGLASRFPEEVAFTSLTSDECLMLLSKSLKSQDLEIPADLEVSTSLGYSELSTILDALRQLSTWGNGRDVKTVSKKAAALAVEKSDLSSPTIKVAMEDLRSILQTMLKEQTKRSAASGKPATALSNLLGPSQPLATVTQTSTPLSSTSAKSTNPASTKQAQAPSSGSSTPKASSNAKPTRDAGVSDDTWNQLQKDEVAAAELDKQAKAEIDDKRHEIEAAKQKQAEEEDELRRLEAAIAEAAAKAEAEQAEEDRRKAEEDRRKAEEARARAAELKRLREEEEKRLWKLREAEAQRHRQEEKAQKKLRNMGVCIAGYRWIKQAGGYRCAGGYHFVSDSHLGI